MIGSHGLAGEWGLPVQARGMVVFSQCGGSRRQGSRDRHVAKLFNDYGLGTVLFDLLTHEEALQQVAQSNISMLSERLQDALLWLKGRYEAKSLPLGLFSSGYGTAAAMVAAALMPSEVRAIVSRSGRPDMADGYLADVRAPTLLIVGAKDPYVLAVNRACAQTMACLTDLKIIPRATHLFEEFGTLDAVTVLAINWFLRYFSEPGDVPVEELLLRR
ncbi:hydrolase [Rhodoferax lacus]|uniref:Hydrolase n=2 Tax=Rhodoferax lacus TaxID=2184758 RepID=A0A3E1R6A9_9BURK|nr:hydrolase [Rhodoferax lacus]